MLRLGNQRDRPASAGISARMTSTNVPDHKHTQRSPARLFGDGYARAEAHARALGNCTIHKSSVPTDYTRTNPTG